MSVNEASIQKKFETLQPTQENIETVSLWCLHHKDHHSTIVNVWMKCFKTVPLKQRLSLIYLTNDVCQRERHKKFDVFRRSFCTVLKEAIMIIRTEEIKQNVERIVDIWKERNIFDDNFINELKAIINFKTFESTGNKPQQSNSTTKEAWLSDFKVEIVINELEKQKNDAEVIQRAKALLPPVPFNTDGNIKALLKDRQEGLKYAKEIDAAHKTLSDFVGDLERRLLNKQKLITLLEQTKIFYETQLSEAKIVETAYRKFGSGVEMVKEELENIKALGLLANGSPIVDAPSPSPNEDPFAQGVEAVAAALKHRQSERTDSIDMELEDEKVRVATNQSFLPSGQNPFASPPRKHLLLDPTAMDKAPIQNTFNQNRMGPGHGHQLPPPPQPPVQSFQQPVVSSYPPQASHFQHFNPSAPPPTAHLGNISAPPQQLQSQTFFNTSVAPPPIQSRAQSLTAPGPQWQAMKPSSGPPAILSPPGIQPGGYPNLSSSSQMGAQAGYGVAQAAQHHTPQKSAGPSESPRIAVSHVTVAADATRLPQPDQIHPQPHFLMHSAAQKPPQGAYSYGRSLSYGGPNAPQGQAQAVSISAAGGPILQPPPPFPVVAEPYGANPGSPETAGNPGGPTLGPVGAATEVEVSLMDEQEPHLRGEYEYYEEGELPEEDQQQEDQYSSYTKYNNRQFQYRGGRGGANRKNLTVLSGNSEADAPPPGTERFPLAQSLKNFGRGGGADPGVFGGPRGGRGRAHFSAIGGRPAWSGGGPASQQHSFYNPRFQNPNTILR